MTHAASGMGLVVVVKNIVETRITDSLDQVTRITQLISFSLIVLLGIVLFVRALTGNRKSVPEPVPEKPVAGFYWAVIMGLIPCPAVVMVLLFCISMDALWLGIGMGVSIGAGMALTLSMVITLAILGKTSLMAAAEKHMGKAFRLEAFIQAAAGLMVAALGLFFLLGAA